MNIDYERTIPMKSMVASARAQIVRGINVTDVAYNLSASVWRPSKRTIASAISKARQQLGINPTE